MKRKLLILRHGKSDWSTLKPDHERPLTDRGRVGAQRIAAWMQDRGLVPDLVVSSPAERALGTAQAACQVLGLKEKKIRLDERIYMGSVEDLLETLADCPAEAEKVMLVGHNPGLEGLVAYLAAGALPESDDGKLLPTATLAVLKIPKDWASLRQGGAELLSITRPDQVAELFRIDTSAGAREVERPAYYYDQSGVIPYRIIEGKLQILVVSSRRGTRWVIPKGIKEADMSPGDSAAKEAWEEAGVKGRVSDQPLGRYSYEKWGGTCSVDVYALEVTECVDEPDREEGHRRRLWMEKDEAIASLEEAGLKELVVKLAQQLKAG